MTRRLVCVLLMCGVCGVTLAAPVVAVFIAEGTASDQSASALAARVTEAIGEPVVMTRVGSALQHWAAIRSDDEALVAFESVQFGAWRVRELGYRLFAVSERTVSYSVVTRPGTTVLDVDDLAGLLIAVPAPPSLPALQLLALFPDPLRAPRLRHVDTLPEGLALLRAGRVDAAVLSESLSRALGDVREVLTLEETPVAVISVAAEVEPGLLARLRSAFAVGGAGPAETTPVPELGALREPLEGDTARFARLLGGTWGASR